MSRIPDIVIHHDHSPALLAALDEFGALREQYQDEFRSAFHQKFADVDLCIDVYQDKKAAIGASDIRIELQPSKAFLEFLAAFRAGERDGF